MKLYIDESGVIKWSPAGWPDKPIEKECQTFIDGACDVRFTCCQSEYNFSISRAKAESVPVKRQRLVRATILCTINGGTQAKDLVTAGSLKKGFYEVPGSEINKEWL